MWILEVSSRLGGVEEQSSIRLLSSNAEGDLQAGVVGNVHDFLPRRTEPGGGTKSTSRPGHLLKSMENMSRRTHMLTGVLRIVNGFSPGHYLRNRHLLLPCLLVELMVDLLKASRFLSVIYAENHVVSSALLGPENSP